MQIGSYQVLFELGRGGMGTVYLGRVRGTGNFERLVAIKRQRKHEAGFDEPPERLLGEARFAGLVHHANVVGIHQAGLDEDGYYFVCDYVEGTSLSGLVNRGRPHPLWPVGVVARVMLDALAGLQAVHDAVDADGRELGMLHRDFAADNLLVGRDGVTRLADFGIAKASRSVPVTDAGLIRGKLPYLAPEYLRAEALDRTIDLYAAGVTLWIALSGQLPWRDRSEAQIMHSILNEGLPALALDQRAPGRELEAVIARACHARVQERYQSAREMLDALEAAVTRAGTVASHVQVAEYVESVAGRELAERRARILSRRRELESTDPDRAEQTRPTLRVIHTRQDEQNLLPTAQIRVPTAPSLVPPAANHTHTSSGLQPLDLAHASQAPSLPSRVATPNPPRALPSFTLPTAGFTGARGNPSSGRLVTPASRFEPTATNLTMGQTSRRELRFTPPAPSFTKPQRAFTTPARSFTAPARSATPAARSVTPAARSGTLSGREFTTAARSFTPPARRDEVSAKDNAKAVVSEPVQLPLAPVLPKIAWLAALLLLLLLGYVALRSSPPRVPPAAPHGSMERALRR